jgi:hypothetical protein
VWRPYSAVRPSSRHDTRDSARFPWVGRKAVIPADRANSWAVRRLFHAQRSPRASPPGQDPGRSARRTSPRWRLADLQRPNLAQRPSREPYGRIRADSAIASHAIEADPCVGPARDRPTRVFRPARTFSRWSLCRIEGAQAGARAAASCPFGPWRRAATATNRNVSEAVCKPSSVPARRRSVEPGMAIHLRPPIARRLVRPTRGLGSAPLPRRRSPADGLRPPIWPCSGWSLPRFTPSTDQKAGRRHRHCGTGPRLTADGCYPPPCAAELGLSSRRPGRPDRRATIRPPR